MCCCIKNGINGFHNKSITKNKEQRKTEWMPFESLKDAIDIDDASKTIEGLPAPKRVVIIANAPA